MSRTYQFQSDEILACGECPCFEEGYCNLNDLCVDDAAADCRMDDACPLVLVK